MVTGKNILFFVQPCNRLNKNTVLTRKQTTEKGVRMPEEVVAVFIPIVMFIVAGLVLVTYFNLASKEKQMLIEKGLTVEEIRGLYARKSDGSILLKIGTIMITFGIGLGVGLVAQDLSSKGYYVPLSIFVFTGTGFVLAYKAGELERNKKAGKPEGQLPGI